MPRETIQRFTEWIALNVANGIYLVKDWLILNIGMGAGTSKITESIVDNWITKGIGISLIVFNVVRIIKYILEIKERNNGKE